jgi:hypothetical protein
MKEAATMTKTLDRYFPAVAEGIDCRVRIYAPNCSSESMIVLVSWIPRPPTELLEPFLSEFAAAFRDGILELVGCRDVEDFSLVEHHALPGGNERLGLVLFGELGQEALWQPLERETLEFITGESLDEPPGSAQLPELRRVPDSQEWNSTEARA